MKTIYKEPVVFDPAAGTIEFPTGFDPRHLYAIINLSERKVLYAAGSNIAGTFTNNVLNLTTDTSLHAAEDLLQIIVDEPQKEQPADTGLYDMIQQSIGWLAMARSVDGGVKISTSGVPAITVFPQGNAVFVTRAEPTPVWYQFPYPTTNINNLIQE